MTDIPVGIELKSSRPFVVGAIGEIWIVSESRLKLRATKIEGGIIIQK